MRPPASPYTITPRKHAEVFGRLFEKIPSNAVSHVKIVVYVKDCEMIDIAHALVNGELACGRAFDLALSQPVGFYSNAPTGFIIQKIHKALSRVD